MAFLHELGPCLGSNFWTPWAWGGVENYPVKLPEAIGNFVGTACFFSEEVARRWHG